MNQPEPIGTAPIEPILLTPEEAARALRINRTRLYALLANGSIPSVQIGHSRRIPVGTLQDYVRRLQTGPGQVDRIIPATVAGERQDGGARPSHRSRRRKPPRQFQAELLPLPFPRSPEER